MLFLILQCCRIGSGSWMWSKVAIFVIEKKGFKGTVDGMK